MSTRDRFYGRRARRLTVWLGAGLLALGCSVTRTAHPSNMEPADEPLLRRANEALLERIEVEKGHVAGYNRELKLLRAKERQTSALVAEAEEDYQRFLGDLAGLNDDLALVKAEAQALAQQRAELEASIERDRAALLEGQARLAEGQARLAALVGRETSLAEELAAHELLVEQRSGQLATLQLEQLQLQRAIEEAGRAGQWLRARLLASLLESSLHSGLPGSEQVAEGQDGNH